VVVVCCHVEVSATGRSLAQRSPTECGVSVCDQVQQYPSRREQERKEERKCTCVSNVSQIK
jgi:hypothetical protein